MTAQLAALSRERAAAARVDVGRFRQHPRRIRTNLGDLRCLTESIRYEGVLTPVLAEQHGTGPGGWLRILKGHRRVAAAELAGKRTVPAIIVPRHSDVDAVFLMLAASINEPLTKADKRRAVLTLRDLAVDWMDIAMRLGRSVATVQAWARYDPDAAPEGPDEPWQGDTPALTSLPSSRPSGRGRPGDTHTGHAGATVTPIRPPAPPRPKVPRIGATRLHELVTSHDNGHLTADQIVNELRTTLGEWTPRATPERIA